MKYTSKNEIYYSKRGNKGEFRNPFVRTLGGSVDTADESNKRLTVPFALQYEKQGQTFELERNTIIFDSQYIPTEIEDENGNAVEILQFLQNGGTYDKSKIVSWGKPNFERVLNYFILPSIWTDLEFADTPYKQLAIDWVENSEYSVKIEGLKLADYFEYQEPEE